MRGVRSRCDRSAAVSRSAARSSSIRPASPLSAWATRRTSGGPASGTRATASPAAIVSARSAVWSRSRTSRRETTSAAAATTSSSSTAAAANGSSRVASVERTSSSAAYARTAVGPPSVRTSTRTNRPPTTSSTSTSLWLRNGPSLSPSAPSPSTSGAPALEPRGGRRPYVVPSGRDHRDRRDVLPLVDPLDVSLDVLTQPGRRQVVGHASGRSPWPTAPRPATPTATRATTAGSRTGPGPRPWRPAPGGGSGHAGSCRSRVDQLHPDPAHAVQVARAGRRLSQLPAQPRQVDVDGPVGASPRLLPDLGQQLALRDDLPRPGRQGEEEVELLAVQLDRFTVELRRCATRRRPRAPRRPPAAPQAEPAPYDGGRRGPEPSPAPPRTA